VVADTTRPRAIADAIGAVLADPEAARAMGERGRAAVVERYHWGVSAERLLEVYAGLG
jgi:glycosyltransferase involved in cell wall biosynthesis